MGRAPGDRGRFASRSEIIAAATLAIFRNFKRSGERRDSGAPAQV
jgi:hypothetical protein